MESMVEDYPEVVYEFEIGLTYEKRPIKAYAFMLGTSDEEFEEELKTRRSVLINAVHHARELTTISQIVYTMMTILHGYEQGNQEFIAQMSNGAIIFIPMVNVDGVTYINDFYHDNRRWEWIRKNR